MTLTLDEKETIDYYRRKLNDLSWEFRYAVDKTKATKIKNMHRQLKDAHRLAGTRGTVQEYLEHVESLATELDKFYEGVDNYPASRFNALSSDPKLAIGYEAHRLGLIKDLGRRGYFMKYEGPLLRAAFGCRSEDRVGNLALATKRIEPVLTGKAYNILIASRELPTYAPVHKVETGTKLSQSYNTSMLGKQMAPRYIDKLIKLRSVTSEVAGVYNIECHFSEASSESLMEGSLFNLMVDEQIAAMRELFVELTFLTSE